MPAFVLQEPHERETEVKPVDKGLRWKVWARGRWVWVDGAGVCVCVGGFLIVLE